MTRDERTAIARAIADAEDGTTGRIAVRIIPDRDVDALERAKREFVGVGLQKHEHAALVLVAPGARRFAVVGGRALHERVGDAFWARVVEQARPHFASGRTADGVIAAVHGVGQALRAHFGSDTK